MDGTVDLKDSLNPQQYEAVTYNEGPLVVFAGAGSGKTRVITYKIYHLITKAGVFPGNILAVTFTNKAAGEMKQRVERLLGSNFNGLHHIWIGTFHSIGARLLRLFGEHIGIKRNFVIYDEEDQLKIIKSVLEELKLSEKFYPPRKLQAIIERIKQEKELSEVKEGESPHEYLAIFHCYTKKLIENNGLDFADLILKSVKLIQTQKEIREFLQEKFRYILVDEFQDTNRIQYKFIKLIAPPQNRVTVVGDDDQSIYSWRGAYVYNILNFQADFPQAKVIKLVKNYRSTRNIVRAATFVIKNNKNRANKELITDNLEGDPLSIIAVEDEIEEAETLASIVRKEINNGVEPEEIAVFYRINAQSRVLEESFRKEKIPYRIVGGFKFYERAEIKDLLSYLRIIHNPNDEISLRRIINLPPRGIGKVTIENLITKSREERREILDVVKEEAALGRHKGLKKFVEKIEEWVQEKDKLRPSQLLTQIIEDIEYRSYLEKHYPLDYETRLQNIEELIGSMLQFEKECEVEGRKPTLEDFLIKSSLMTSEDIETGGKTVSLMTVHSAKGLEFDVVFIVGLEEGLFPYKRYGEEENEEEEEEERRLFYVALTRAKKRVYLFYAYQRSLFGRIQLNIRSRFIEELPKSCVKEFTKETTLRSYFACEESILKGESFLEEQAKFGIGSIVQHPEFGKGVVMAQKKSGSKLILTVNFTEAGIKNLLPSKLSVLK